MRELLEPYFSRIKFTKEQKKHWFHDREGLLFGFGVGFYIFLRIPLLGVLIYGIAEASTAYLITSKQEPCFKHFVTFFLQTCREFQSLFIVSKMSRLWYHFLDSEALIKHI